MVRVRLSRPALWLAPVMVALATCRVSPPPPPISVPIPSSAAEAPTGFDDRSNGANDDSTHEVDQEAFDEVEEIADGLGPLYNAQACRECHQNPTSGGASQITELRVGHLGPDGRFRDEDIPIARGTVTISGRTLINDRAICPNAAFPDSEIQERVPDTETIRTAPARDTVLAATPAARRGSELFDAIGCATCHVRTLVTAAAGTAINGGTDTIPPALGEKAFHPFGDFLLHNVGTGDGIVMAMPEHYGPAVYKTVWKEFSIDSVGRPRNKVRTAPLWGVRLRPRLMHDAASLTLRDAIVRHRGEASDVSNRFGRLTLSDQEAIIAFLESL